MENELNQLCESLGVVFLGSEKGSGFFSIQSADGKTKDLLEVLCRNSQFWCDHLISISGTHRLGPPEIVSIHYHLASIPTGLQVHIFEEKPVESQGDWVEFESVTSVWKSANWHERETAELYGIRFIGHPDPRYLLLPATWQGFPLRKNYVEQETYHGVQVKY